ncbi:MAG TPA: Gfo/Idh/MocA family oxidoreductase [Phycisphaerae bacterium]|nr:Gfo/Idh/MocA family oxidoreductase [Phycisphaerae bacterium]
MKKTRREFLKKTLYAGAGIWVVGNAGCEAFQMTPRPRRISPNEKMNVAGIGAGGKGSSDIADASKGNNIVAIAEVDFGNDGAKKTFEKFPDAGKYKDFRVMLDKMDKQIDAVTVSTPDHQHYVATIKAMKMGKHVYTQKPLTHDVWEARMLTEAACKYPVVTQMGNQGTAEDGLREAVEVVQSGAIGPVREVHVWTNRPVWPQGISRPKDTAPVPATLDWDLWLGTAPWRPYHPKAYNPFVWRGWWDFGTGALGDMACHTANMAFMALKLGYPTSIESECAKDLNDETFPTWSIVRYEFPARGTMPPLKWTWYDGGNNKPAKAVEAIKALVPGKDIPGSGSILVGDAGTLFSPNDYGAKYQLLPEEKFKDVKKPTPWLPRAGGKHCEEWLNACKGQGKTMSNFGYAGLLTETVVLGCVALKVGKKILWDGPNMKVTNCPEANKYIRREYRKGWDSGYDI